MSVVLYEPPVVGIIGLGHLGRALLEGIVTHTYHTVKASDVRPVELIKPIFSRIEVTQDNNKLAEQVEVLILAVRPQDMEEVLDEIKQFTGLLITFAAGS
jgi:pyrroline-5-carboxylate reductase